MVTGGNDGRAIQRAVKTLGASQRPDAVGARLEHGQRPLDRTRTAGNLDRMTATAFLDLKQRAAKLSEKERQGLSAFLIRLGQERAGWKQETARRLNEMSAGKKVSVSDLRRKLGHA